MGVKENQAAEMRDKLEAFLIKSIKCFPVPPTELLNFVEYPYTVRLGEGLVFDKTDRL